MGRFTSQDSFLGNLDQPPSLHRYVYGWNRPTFWRDPSGHAPGDEQDEQKLQRQLAGRQTTIGPARPASTTRGAVYYAAEAGLEFVSPIPLGLSDPDTSIHPLAPNSQSSTWLTGANQASADYAAFKEQYGRGAQVVEGAAVMKVGGKPGKIIGGIMILGAVAFGGKPEVNGTQGEDGNFGPDKGDREPLPPQKEAEQRAAADSDRYRGGPHGETKGPKGDQLESHHMPADSTTDLPKDKGPAIQMERADHLETSSHGSKGVQAAEYRAKIEELIDKGEWRKALAEEIKDVRRVAGTKYNQAIKEMLEYARTLKEAGFLKKVEK